MRSLMRVRRNLVLLYIIFVAVVAGILGFGSPGIGAEEPGEDRGRIAGVVVNSATGGPVAGAYVAVDRSGDAGGTNLGRFREQGIYATGETDEAGRFLLEGVAFRDDHPFMVTHPGFVRHMETVGLRRNELRKEMRIALSPAAAIDAKVVDAEGNVLKEDALLRLEASDGRAFLPMRADWPGPPYRVQSAKSGEFSFGELDTGVFSIEVLRVDSTGVIYHGRVDDIAVKAGESKEVVVKPAEHPSSVKVTVQADPYGSLGERKGVVGLMITRRPGLLAWACRNFHHPEDARLGRVIDNAVIGGAVISPEDPEILGQVGATGRRAWVSEGGSGSFMLVSPDRSCTLRNFPPGEYAVFTYAMGMYKGWTSPAIYLRGAKAVFSEGKQEAIEIPWVEPIGPSSASTRVFGQEVTLEAKDYAAGEICDLLIKETGGSPGVLVADPSIEGKSVALPAGKIQVWDLLETIYLKKGWKLEADIGAGKVFLRPEASGRL